jgi:hypothetical protein
MEFTTSKLGVVFARAKKELTILIHGMTLGGIAEAPGGVVRHAGSFIHFLQLMN